MSDQISEMPIDSSDNGITLELGDIIQINAQKNERLHENTFFISYIDDQDIEIHNISTFEPTTLIMDENGILTDESIQEILLLSRSEETGYARQHLLLPNTWVDLHFNGDPYTSITGEITNLEEDMIEITTYPDMNVIYIDFGYQGIPKHLPLENITIRTKPKSLEKIASLVDIRDQDHEAITDMLEKVSESESSMHYSDTGDIIIRLPEGAQPDKSVHDKLQETYSVADEIIYEEELGNYVRRVEIPAHMQRFSIETQVNDMLDELLMEIPVEKRTHRVMDDIHLLIERFRELRDEFSHFDENGNVKNNRFLGKDYKPLVERIKKLDQKLKWIVPVVTLRKKIYSIVPNDTYQDVEQLSMGDVLMEDQRTQEEYQQNQMRIGEITPYVHYNQITNPSFTPMDPPADGSSFLTSNQSVNASLEGIVNNLEDFYSTVSFITEENEGYARKQYVIQKYELGSQHLGSSVSKGGKKVFVREPMTPNDEMTIRSLITLPLPVLHFSKVNLPMSSILTKTQYSQHFLQMDRVFHKKLDITTQNVSLRENKSDEIWKMWGEDDSRKQSVQDFVIDEHDEYSEDRFDKYLQSVFPGGETVVRMLDKLYPESRLSSMLSIHRATNALEPFMIYHDNLNYAQYNSMRFFIKEQIKKYRIDKNIHDQQLNEYKMQPLHNFKQKEASLLHIFFEKQDLLNVFLESYQLKHSNQSNFHESLSSSEIYSKILSDDFGTLFYNLLQFMMASLVVPEKMMSVLNGATEVDDMERLGEIKASDCARRNLTKKYTSLDQLHKDNGNADLYYDSEYDFTPYNLLSKYKDERKRLNDEDFADFLTEVLVQKHDGPPKVSVETVADIMFGKKIVREGEYAIVEIKPEPKTGLDEDSMTPNEKRAMTMEADLRKKVAYYRRLGNQWVVDQDVDENAFIDSSELFCNMSKICFKDQKSKQCESMDDASKRLRSHERKKITAEFDERFAKSSRDMEEELKEKVEISMRKLKSLLRYHHVKAHKSNNMAFELGRFVKKQDGVRSPSIESRDKILAQGDFVKLQSDILLFVERCCRDPMVDQLQENPYMLYCTKTNTPLLPTFYWELAQAFVSSNTYSEKLGEIVRKQGVEEGDTIFDKFTGSVLRKIDNVAEDTYDADGFKQVTSSVVEEDVGSQYIEMMSGKSIIKDAVFEDEESQMIFNLYRGIVRNLGIPLESIQEKVMRISQEIVAKTVTSKKLYEIDAKEKEEATKRRGPPYEIYRNKSIILTVASVILYAIQTITPSFRIHKTFPGCVQSFDGFPDKEGSMENTMGVEYIACILNKMKTKTTKPWNAIKPLPVEIIKSQMMQIIQAAILPNNEYMEEYAKKAEYLLLHPDQDIPKLLSVQRWVQFLPPIVKFSVKKGLRGLSNEYKEELIEMQKKGSKQQRDQLSIFMTKCHTFGFGIIEAINEIVKSKGLLLKTASKVYYTENACCNDRFANSTLQYFEDDNIEITAYIKMIKSWQKVIYETKRRARASFLYDPRRTGLTFASELPSSHFETNVYLSFIHYCHLDDLHPIPVDLQPLFPEKIPDYPKTAILAEKITFLKSHGKRFNTANLKQLMAVIHRRNLVDTYINNEKGSRIQGLNDFLSYADERYGTDEDNVLSYSLREKMRDVLNKYNPKIMVIEDNEETYKLNNWLTHANEDLLLRITAYLETHVNLSSAKVAKLQDFLANIHMWNNDQHTASKKDESSMFVVAQFLRNAITANSKVFPEMILTNHIANTKSHKYWNFSYEHDLDISHFIRDYYKSLDKFKKDPVLHRLIGDVKEQLVDVNLFLSMIPLHSPYHKVNGGETQSFYSLFDKRTVYMIYCYVYYSVLYEYIRATDNDELRQMDVLERRELRRDAIRENTDEFILGVSTEDYQTREEAEYGNERIEVDIVAGNEEEMKQRIAELLLSFLEIDILNKKSVDITYEENDRKVVRTRLKEKKLITDFLRDLDPEQRRVEDMNKMMKIGRWNVGMRAGLVKYDKGRYNEERRQLFEQLNGRLDLEEISDVPVRKTAEQLNQDEVDAVDEFYDNEATDIHDFRGDDADGGYYEEDFEGEMEE
jgi:hypothetical protein